MTDQITEDRLLGGRLVIRQPREGFRVAIDSVLLAASVPASAGDHVFEPGAGVGAAALMLAARVPDCRVAGLEKQPALVRLANENVRLNAMDGRVDIMVGDLANPPPRLSPGGFDHVMLNPPFYEAGRATIPDEPGRRLAHVEDGAGLDDWLVCAIRMLKPKGSLSLIHRADRLVDILAGLDGRAGEITVFPLWPKSDGTPAKRVLVRARRDVASPLRLAAGLVLHVPDGGFTPEADAVLRGAALRI
jgi:tRNA1(Val) A37 N6-methylase TrmN6